MMSRSLPTIFRLVLFIAVVQISSGQYQRSSKDAAILSDSRYLSAGGQFGSAYKQEDGVEFKEESDGAGNRRGSYSYVDPTGQRRTVTYTAGKDGFRASGDHLPVAPIAPPVVPAPAVPTANSYYSGPEQVSTYSSGQDYEDDGQWKNDVSNSIQYNSQPSQFVNPDTRPVQFQYQSPLAPSYSGNSFNPTTEPVSQHRFFPPGKLNLNRSPDGFSYTFNKS